MSVGLYSHTTRATGTVLTASIYNSDHQNHITNQNPLQTGAYSDSVGEYQTKTDPGGIGTEVLAPHLAGEIERIRFCIARITGKTHWYEAPDNDLGDIGSPEDLLFSQTLRATGDLTPAQIVANQNNYAPTGHADAFTFRLSADAARNITGLAGGVAGRIVILDNVGANVISLTHEDAASTAGNRFTFNSGQAPLTISAGEAMMLRYDGTALRWRAVNSADQASPSFTNITTSGNATIGGNATLSGYGDFSEISPPASPAANVLRGYAFDDSGITRLGTKDSAGNIVVLYPTPARAYDDETAHVTTTSVIPVDDTIPQVGEGAEILSLSIAAKRADSKIRVSFSAFASIGNNETGVFALFYDGGADAIQVTTVHLSSGNQIMPSAFVVEITPGDTSSHAFSVRMGSGSGATMAINGTSLARRFGGAARAVLIAEEIFVS